MEYRELGKTGVKVSALSFGASSLGGVFHEINENDAIRTVHVALDLGVNYIDVSPFYGLTKAETVLGKALRGIDRESYLLSTKVGRYGSELKDFDFSAKRVRNSIDESLSRLGVTYVDMILAHDIEFGDLDQIVNETIPELRKIQRKGKARFIGVTGLPLKVFRHVADRVPIDVILSYCHGALNDGLLLAHLPYFDGKGIGVINASPLSMGLLSSRPPPAWHPAPPQVRELCAKAAAHCKARGKSIEELAVRFACSQPPLPTTLVGTADPDNIKRNIEVLDQPIDQELLMEVFEILKPIDGMTWPSGRPENN
jgi:L-galactose dehydrogenase